MKDGIDIIQTDPDPSSRLDAGIFRAYFADSW